jgi:hypothetical protein
MVKTIIAGYASSWVYLIKRVPSQRHMTESTIHGLLKIKTSIPGRKHITVDIQDH